MSREGDVCAKSPRRVGKAERVAPPKAVPRHGQLGHIEGVPQVVDGDINDGIRHLRSVGGQKGCRVERWVVEIRGSWLAVEQIRSDGEETSPGEGVSKSDEIVSGCNKRSLSKRKQRPSQSIGGGG